MSTKFASKTGRVAAGGSLLVGGVAGALVLAPQAGAATTYTVTNTNDDGAGSLRQAVADANNNAGADIIVFDASAAGTITLTTGEIAIRDDITITGLGAVNSIISGNNNSRIFYMYDSAAMLTISISALTLTDGSTGYNGGAILSTGNDLTLSSIVITGNASADEGGGVYSGDTGGNLYSGDTGRNAQLTIIDSEISDNTATYDGGGLKLHSVGDVTITNTVISDNTATYDGGGLKLHSVGDVTITNTVISGNTAGREGGGAAVDGVGNVLIHSSTIDQNTSGNDGGGLYSSNNDSLTITNSTVSGNQASDGAGLSQYLSGEVLIANSTIANNVADSNNGDGGALYSYSSDGDIRIIFCTISGNSANSDTVRLRYLNGYGVDLTGTIISDNTTIDGSGTQAVDLDLDGPLSAAVTVSSSLIMGTTAGGSFTDGGGNVNGVSAQLGVLADNGGATFTMEPAVGSPVIDAGPLTWTAFTGDGFDQRLTPYVRVYNGRSDMGAFEVQSELAPLTTTTTVGTDPVVPAFTG
jgi:hypothetical protein